MIAWWVFFPFGVEAEPLTPNQIINAIPGRWAIIPEDTKASLSCESEYVDIWIRLQGEKLVYHSRWAEEIKVIRSDIRTLSDEKGEKFPGILLVYEDEKRTDDNGNPVEWLLVMPDENSFYWQRRDWPFGYRTVMRKRCSSNDLLG